MLLTPLKNSVVDLLNEADEQAAVFLTPQQQDMDDDSPVTYNSNLGEDNDITLPHEYVVKLLGTFWSSETNCLKKNYCKKIT